LSIGLEHSSLQNFSLMSHAEEEIVYSDADPQSS